MSGGAGTSSSTTSVTPTYGANDAAIQAVLQAAQNTYNTNQGAISAYPGSTPVSPSGATLQGQQSTLNAANNIQQNLLPAVSQATNFGLLDVLYPQSNPALQASIDAAIRPVTQQYTDPGGVLAQIRADATGAGQYGGTRQNLAEGVAGGRYLKTIGDIASQRTSDAYNQGLDTFSKVLSLAPQLANLQTVPGTLQSGVGTQQEAYQQAMNDYTAAAKLWGVNAPWQNLSNYASLVYGGSTPGSTTTSSSSVSAPSTLNTSIGTGLIGANLATSLGIDPVVGTALGLLTGLLKS